MPRRHYTAHLDCLTIPVETALSKKLGRGPVMITPQQYRLVAAVFDGWRGQQRDLAARLGYTIGGVNKALRHLARLGFWNLTTQRGRHGWTQVRVQAIRVVGGLARAVREMFPNVERDSSTYEVEASTSETFPVETGREEPEPPDRDASRWRTLDLHADQGRAW